MIEKEKFEILEKEEINEKIYCYLKNIFDGLNIEILGDYQGKLFDLMNKGRLEGWCWQTTETAALFMDDDTIVYRGNLYFNEYKTYYHSFIKFNYENEEYVFDPCFSLINKKDLYFKVFNVDIKGQVTAKEIKKYFLNYVSNYLKKEKELNQETINSTERFMRKFFGDLYEEKKKEITIYDRENPSSPMYRNGAGYRDINTTDNKIKSLTVHYYLNG